MAPITQLPVSELSVRSPSASNIDTYISVSGISSAAVLLFSSHALPSHYRQPCGSYCLLAPTLGIPSKSWEDYWQSLPLVPERQVEEFDERRSYLQGAGQHSILIVQSPSEALRLLAFNADNSWDETTQGLAVKSAVVLEGKEYPSLLEAFVHQRVLPRSPYLLRPLGVYRQQRSVSAPPCVHLLLPEMRLDLRAAAVAALRKRVAIDFRLLLGEMVLALEVLHKAGYLHRDIKPQNFLVSPQGHVVLADFDGVWPLGLPVAHEDDIQGTTNYVPPELLQVYEGFSHPSKPLQVPWDEAVELLNEPEPTTEKKEFNAFTTRSDVWSLGVTAKELSEQLQRLGPLEDAALLEDLLSRMTRPVDARPTIEEIKQHPYFRRGKIFLLLKEDSELRPVRFLSSLRRTEALLANRRSIVNYGKK